MEIDNSVLSSPGSYKTYGSKGPVSLLMKNRKGQVLFSSSVGAESYLDFQVVEKKGHVVYGIYSGKIGSLQNKKAIYYHIYDGELWIKL